MRCPASSSVTLIQRTAALPGAIALPSLGMPCRLYVVDFQEIDRPDGTRRMPRKASRQVNVAHLPDQAAMVNESHALDARIPRALQPRGASTKGGAIQRPQAPDEENQRSSLSLTSVTHQSDF